MTLRYVTFGLASIGLVLAIISVVDTFLSRNKSMLNRKAIALLCLSIHKDRGDCKVEGNGMVIHINEVDGKICVALGVKRESVEVHN